MKKMKFKSKLNIAKKQLESAAKKYNQILNSCDHRDTEIKYTFWDNEFHKGTSKTTICKDCGCNLSDTKYES